MAATMQKLKLESADDLSRGLFEGPAEVVNAHYGLWYFPTGDFAPVTALYLYLKRLDEPESEPYILTWIVGNAMTEDNWPTYAPSKDGVNPTFKEEDIETIEDVSVTFGDCLLGAQRPSDKQAFGQGVDQALKLGVKGCNEASKMWVGLKANWGPVAARGKSERKVIMPISLYDGKATSTQTMAAPVTTPATGTIPQPTIDMAVLSKLGEAMTALAWDVDDEGNYRHDSLSKPQLPPLLLKMKDSVFGGDMAVMQSVIKMSLDDAVHTDHVKLLPAESQWSFSNGKITFNRG